MRRLLTVLFITLTFNVLAQSDADRLKQALELLEKGSFIESNELLIPLYSKNYMKGLVCYNISVNFFNMKNFVKAEKYASEAVEMNTDYSKQAAVIKGKCLNISGKVADEEKFYHQMTVKYPGEFLFHNLLADNLLKQKKYEKAKEELKKSISLDRFGAKAHYKLGKTEEREVNFSKSLLCYYYFLMTEKNPALKKEIILSIAKIMNFNEVDRIISEKTLTANSSKEDGDLVSAMLFLNGLEKFSQTDSLPEIKKMVKNSRKFLTDITESIEEPRTGFYEEFYVSFYDKLLKNNLLDTFLYYSLITVYPEISKEIKGVTKEKMLKFADFLEK